MGRKFKSPNTAEVQNHYLFWAQNHTLFSHKC